MKTGFAASVAALTLFTAGHAQATDGTWTSTTGTWNTTGTGNWSGGVIASGADATADFSKIHITAATPVTLGSAITIGNLIFGDTGSTTQILTVGGTNILTLAGSNTPTITVGNVSAGISAALAGTSGFAKSGTGTLILSGSHNGLTGTITVNDGKLDLRNPAAYTNTFNLASATASLDNAYYASGTVTISGLITGLGKISKTSSVSTLILTSSNSFSGGTTLSDGSLFIGDNNAIGSGTLTINRGTFGSTDNTARTFTNALNLNLSGNLRFGALDGATTGLGDLFFADTTGSASGPITSATISVFNSTTVTLNRQFANGQFTKAGGGTLALNGTGSTYSGTTTILGGVLSTNKLSNVNTASSIGKGSVAGSANDLVINSGTLRYTGAGDSSNRSFTLGTGGGAIEASGSGALTLTGSVVLTSGSARTFILTGTNTGTNSFGANLVDDGSNATSFTKSGVGRWILTGSNTYTGATTINNGELDVNGSLGAGSTVTISSGAILGGSGKIGGSVNSTGGTVNGNGLNISGSTTFSGASTLSGLNTVGHATISSGSTNLSGTTTVSSGTFSVAMGATLNNNGVISGTTSVAGLMKGNGSILGDLALSGTLSPGNSTGTTTINGNLAMESSAVLVMEVTGLNSHDLVSVSGNVQLAGTLDLSTLSGLSLGDTITLIDNTGIGTITNGYFSEIITTGSTYIIAGASTTYTIIIGENKYLINYAANAGGDSAFNDVTLTVIPEPATWAMIMGGLGMLAFGQRLRRQQ